SSAARIRIKLGLALIASSSSFSRRHRPARFCIGNRGRNSKLDLGPGIEFTPDTELSPHKFGALVHTRQAEVPAAPASSWNARIKAFSVIPDPHAKLPLIIPDFHFDSPGVRVPECVAQRLAGDPVDLVPHDWSEVSRCAFHLETKFGRILAGSEFFS